MPKNRATRNSEIIRAKIALFGRRLGHASYRLWLHPDLARLYKEFIYQSYSIIKASVPLMIAAESTCRSPQHADDPVLQGFGEYLCRHIPEETGHVEWILDDGEAMGLDRGSIKRRLPIESATQLVGMQYYWIYHYSPIALGGYIATMEGSPDPVEFVQSIARRNKLSLTCFSSLLYHAKIDPHHRRDLDDVFDSLPLTDEHFELIGLSSIRTIGLMTRIVEGILTSG